MNPFTPQTHDDRGTLRPLCRPTASNIQPLPGEALFPILAGELRQRRKLRWLLPTHVALIAAVAAVALLIGFPRVFIVTLAIFLIALELVVVPAIGLVRYRHPDADLFRHDLRVALLASARCASCGYLLSPQHPDPDGCTTCPECGAAWRLTSTQPPSPP